MAESDPIIIPLSRQADLARMAKVATGSEVMIEVWKNAARYEGRSALKSWIFSIARNKSIDQNRKGSRISYTDKVPESVDLSRDALEVVAASQDAGVLKKAMATMFKSPKLRDAPLEP